MKVKTIKTKAKIIILLTLVLVLISGCGQSTSRTGHKPAVAVSIVPQATFVKEVAGDLVDVTTLIPPGSSAETYAPTPQQLQDFSHASIYFSIGVPPEQASILPRFKDFNANLKIVDLAEHVSKVYPDLEITPGERDPHIWLSPKRVKVMVDVIADELAELDPQNKDIYKKNALNYKEQLDEVDSKIRDSLANLENKTFIVYHPAFAYFAHDYGLDMIALEEEGKEATPQTFKKVIDIAKENKIKVIFYQAEMDSRQSEAFAEEIGGKTQQIEPLAANYLENLEKMANTFSEVLQ